MRGREQRGVRRMLVVQNMIVCPCGCALGLPKVYSLRRSSWLNWATLLSHLAIAKYVILFLSLLTEHIVKDVRHMQQGGHLRGDNVLLHVILAASSLPSRHLWGT